MSQMAHPVLELSQAPALKEQQEGTFVKKKSVLLAFCDKDMPPHIIIVT